MFEKGVRGRVGNDPRLIDRAPDGFILGPGDDKANELDVANVGKGWTEPPSGFRYSGRSCRSRSNHGES